MLGNLIWRLSGAATSSYLFSLLIQVAPPSPSKTHLRLCGCLLYWCIHFVAVTKGPSCLSSLASFFFHPYLHVDWAKGLHCSMSIRSAMHPPTSNPPRFLVSRHTAISWVTSAQVYTTSLLLLPLCWLHTRKLPKQNNPPIYSFVLLVQRQQLKQKVPCRQLMLCHVFLPSHSFHCRWWLVLRFPLIRPTALYPSQCYYTTYFLVLPCQPSHKQKTVQVNTFSHQDLVTM